MRIFYNKIELRSEAEEKGIDLDSIKPSEENVKEECMLYEFLLTKYPEGFKYAKKVYINKDLIEIDDYDTILKENDIVTVSGMPTDPATIILIMINIAISIVMAMIFKPKTPYQSEQRSAYSAKVNQIEAGLNEAIPIQYGTFRSYPKLISESYKFYDNNEEYHLLHTCLGMGNYDLEKVYLNETNVDDLVSTTQARYYQRDVGSKSTYLDSVRNLFSDIPDNFIGIVAHKPRELENIEINTRDNGDDDIKKIGYTVVNANGSKINRILVNFNFSSGIFNVDEEDGSDIDSSFAFELQAREIDENDVETGYNFVKSYSGSYTRRTPLRETVIMNLKTGRYKLYIKRTDVKNGNNDTKACTITSVVGLDPNPRLDKASNVSLMSFIVKVGEGYSSSSGVKMNVDMTRRPDNNSNYATLLDFVKDVWTNTEYGMGESLEYLDIREELSEPISLLLDQKDNAYDQIKSVLKSFGYQLVPYLTHFIVKKKGNTPYRTLTFSSSNTSDISMTYNIPSEDELQEGVQGRYVPAGEIDFETIQYPEDMKGYDETVLLGVSDEATAREALIRFYKEKTRILKSCAITTDLEGIVPEIGSRIGVTRENVTGTLNLLGHSLIDGVITLKQKFKFEAGKQYYVEIETINNDSFDLLELEVFAVDTFTDTVALKNSFITLDIDFWITIGDKTTMTEDYLIVNIKPGAINEDINSPTTVTLECQEYVEGIYD